MSANCPSCGAQADADWKFCMRCGAALAEAPAGGAPPAPAAPPVFRPEGAAPAGTAAPSAAEILAQAAARTGYPAAEEAPRVLPFAGFWTRTWAYGLDSLILWFAIWALYTLAGVASSAPMPDFGGIDPMDPTGDLGAMMEAFGEYGAFMGRRVAAQSVMTWAYFTFFTGAFGQTPGKMALGLKVVDARGEPPGLGRAALREIPGKLLSSIALSLGFLWVAFDARKQGWHDKIAGTYVVRTKAREAGLPIPER